MPIYPFQSDDGEVIERSYSMKDAPPLGTLIEHEGKSYKRVVARIVGVQDRGFIPFKDMTVMDHHPHAPRVDKEGRPIFKSQREVDTFIKKHNDSGQSGKVLHWDR
jgi:hypothetical protein